MSRLARACFSHTQRDIAFSKLLRRELPLSHPYTKGYRPTSVLLPHAVMVSFNNGRTKAGPNLNAREDCTKGTHVTEKQTVSMEWSSPCTGDAAYGAKTKPVFPAHGKYQAVGLHQRLHGRRRKFSPCARNITMFSSQKTASRYCNPPQNGIYCDYIPTRGRRSKQAYTAPH